MHSCPNNVPTQEIVGAVRRSITGEKGLSFMGKSVSSVIGSKRLMAALAKSSALLSPLVLGKIPESSGLRLRIPTPFMKNRTLPEPAPKNLFDRTPEYIQGKPGKPIVGFFAGCSMAYIYPQIGEAMISVLKRMGYSIYIPASQRCCGLPALCSGNGELVEKLAQTNVREFSYKKLDDIITACASCNGGIGEYYGSMKTDYDAFTEKVIDFSVFLKKEGLFDTLSQMQKWPNSDRVTYYHDPCHLKTQGITQEPRQLLKLLPNVDFVEMEGADRCCGFGGTFSVYHYGKSKAIGAQKIDGLKQSGAALIATACPGCIMQLQDSINHAGLQVKAVHLLELLAKVLDPANRQ